MNSLGKRIIVYTMVWVILVMIIAQLYDNFTGRNAPPSQASTAAAALPVDTPDPDVQHLADLQSCVASDPNNLQCVTDLANLYYDGQQWDMAQTNYLQAVKLNPHDASLLLKLAGTQIYQDQFKDAVPTLQKAEALQPDAPEIHLLLGLALSKLQPAQMPQAVAEWRQVLRLSPNSAWATQASQYR